MGRRSGESVTRRGSLLMLVLGVGLLVGLRWMLSSVCLLCCTVDTSRLRATVCLVHDHHSP